MRQSWQAENHPPVCANGHGPKTFHLAFERMQPEAWHIHVGHRAGCIESRENVSQFNNVFSNDAARVVVFVKALQPFVADRANQSAP